MSVVLTDTISLPELLWTVVSLIAAFYVTRVFRRAMGTLSWLRGEGINGVRDKSAVISLVTYGALLFLELCNSISGIIAMAIPSVSSTNVHPFTYVIASVFIVKSIFIMIAVFIIDRMQVNLIKEVEARQGSEI